MSYNSINIATTVDVGYCEVDAGNQNVYIGEEYLDVSIELADIIDNITKANLKYINDGFINGYDASSPDNDIIVFNKCIDVGDIDVEVGNIEVEVGDVDTNLDINLDNIIEALEDEDFAYIVDNYKSEKASTTTLVLSRKSMEDNIKVDMLEKIYNKFSLTELEEIFKDKL